MQLGIDGAKKRREEFEGVQGGLEGGARAVSVEEREALARRARDAFVVEDERHGGGVVLVRRRTRGVGVVRAHGVDDAAEDVASRVWSRSDHPSVV